jgi:predicted nucleic acid-binding protein
VKVLFDTNVVLDVVLSRAPFQETAARLVAAVELGKLTGALGATTLTTIYYLTAKVSGKAQARTTVKSLVALFEIAAVGRDVLARAADSPLVDFEDAVLHEAGVALGVDAIVTRDPQGFRGGSLPIFSPEELNNTSLLQ